MRQRRNNTQRFCRRIKNRRQARLVLLTFLLSDNPRLFIHQIFVDCANQ